MKTLWYGMLVGATVSVSEAQALPSCDRDGVLFVATEAAQERDVPKSTAIRVKLGASATAVFDCILLTQTGSVLNWQEVEGCVAGSPSLVVRWRADGTVGTACDPPPVILNEEKETDDDAG